MQLCKLFALWNDSRRRATRLAFRKGLRRWFYTKRDQRSKARCGARAISHRGVRLDINGPGREAAERSTNRIDAEPRTRIYSVARDTLSMRRRGRYRDGDETFTSRARRPHSRELHSFASTRRQSLAAFNVHGKLRRWMRARRAAVQTMLRMPTSHAGAAVKACGCEVLVG